ncbi:MAG TPA: BTAD domain-containing putative transcriptional regulator [Gemmatimonadota bacterium]|nr:BTAD domain-containing putative transcriptional regulator [Gemmatimonadota bacterium]
MSAELGNAPPAPTFRLQTLGRLALRGPAAADAPTADFAQQNRRLAVLAAVAAAGERGRNRDQLLLFFWPDASQQRARHSLEQTLYLIRRSVDAEAFLGVNPLRLNPSVVACDVEEFEAAIGAGDLAAAAELYQGPFLEGFYLSDAPEFEQWMDGERSRLEALYLKALERLAENAEGARDTEAAVAWWRKLSDADPLSTRYALGLMRGLASAGDHAAALRHARTHERLVEKELGAGAGPEIATLAGEIRAHARESPVGPPPERDVGRGPARIGSEPRTSAGPDPGPQVDSDLHPPASSRESANAESTSPQQAARRPRANRWYPAAAALVLVAAVLASIWLRSEPTEPALAEAAESSIAVLPLSNLSTDPDDALLADGMTEELIAMLAKTGHLRVIASTSAFAFRERQIDVRAIADSLHVANVLEGGVQKIGSRLRVQVRLVDARDGSTRWSETYDREIEDLFVVQQEIAGNVARELGARLGRGELAPPTRNRARNVAAYELYLRGNDPANLRSESGPHQALEYFRQAIAIDSTYAAAWAGLARMYGRVQSTEDPGMPIEDLRALSEEAALKALALDDSLAEAHATLGITQLHVHQDFATAESELRRAIELDPAYGRAREWLVGLYLDTERPVQALAEARRALEIDPLSPSAHAELAHALLANDRPDEALVHLEQIAAVRPPLLRTSPLLAQAYGKKGMWREAVATMEPRARAGDSGDLALYAYMLARGGRREEALGIGEELIERWDAGEALAVDVAIVYAGLGELDSAFAWIDRAEDPGALRNRYITLMAPIFEDLRRDPRFNRVRERLGIQKR